MRISRKHPGLMSGGGPGDNLVYVPNHPWLQGLDAGEPQEPPESKRHTECFQLKHHNSGITEKLILN